MQKSDTLKDAAISQKADSLQGLVVPEPVTGMKQYKKYLKKNLIYPADDACAEVKGKVTLTFFVSKEGRPFDIKVKESLCQSLDKEAIRLIQEGGLDLRKPIGRNHSEIPQVMWSAEFL